MKVSRRSTSAAIGAAVVSLFILGAASTAAAQESFGSRTEVSLMGGIQALNKNDTALPDRFVNIPAVATVTYRVTPRLAAEGEFTWMIPVKQSIDVGSGASQDRKTPDVLAYQANLRADFPVRNWSPYLVAGAGAVTFLSNTDADRVPQLDKSQTAFAINFGAGTTYGITERWALRADLRELVAFPSDGATGLADASGADQIWMERGTVGLSYKF
ncbi:MAG: porin family protein [Candidatus Eisenbacteria bacterium]|uniref:Porin family protein n=1 Tax=Eiseniibacteriota bacterium TaxID=2212470 RepID=A0A538TS35_UNCEI|nr:MAG: porin family protein [Candidatus Eisenbacteria bacterium]TMQ66405.1 MAG: porin family protein [Candidatus Eisenbacteria bacterium]